MSCDLASESGTERSFSAMAWALILNVAEAYGWNPAGSQPPPDVDPADWGGDYDTNDGQRVSAEDAAALARALERALRDPRRNEKERQISCELNEEVRWMEIEAFGEDVNAEEDTKLLTTDDATLTAVIEFLQGGSFTIK